MTPRQRLLLHLLRSWYFPSNGGNLRVFPKRRISAQVVSNPVPLEMDLPGKLIPVGRDNDTDLVLECYGAPGTTITFAIQGNVQVYRGKNGTNPIVPGTPYGASGFVFDTNTYNPYGGVTTLYVQAMTPDDNVGDSIITATMSTQSNGVTPPPDKVRATAYDVVVSWEDGTGDNGATLDGNPNGGGQRVFPEQETPDPSSLKNVVDLVFKTEPLNLGYEVTGYYKLLDPNNYAYEDADGWKGNDNYWKQSSGVKTVTIPANGIRTISGEIVEAHAGDNWIAVSSASKARVTASQMNDVSKAKRYDVIITIDDEPANRSEMLTVWRTLNVECDIMSYPGMSSSGMNPADYLGGIVEKQLARACIVIRDLTPAPNASPPSPAAMVMTKEEYYAILGWNETTEEFDENSNCGRDLFGNSKKFWTVRIVMASKFNFASIVPNVAHPWAPGVFHYETNTIVIFYESIQSHYTYPSHINSAIRWFLLHEIGHALIDDNHTPGSVMQDIIYPSYVLEEKYQKFLLQDIKKIQEYSRVNPIEGGES